VKLKNGYLEEIAVLEKEKQEGKYRKIKSV
jgi:hypothetical protein